MVHLYIGEGKGKTTAALGLALRASGWGWRVYIGQFLKDCRLACGEKEAAGKLNIKFERFSGQQHPMFTCNNQKQRVAAVKSIDKSLDEIDSFLVKKQFDLIVLDEILSVYAAGLVKIYRIKNIVAAAKKTELVLTGRSVPASIVKKADYVSRIEKIKHPFDRGVLGRKGIEY